MDNKDFLDNEEAKNELDDIILDKNGDNKRDIKKIALIAAALLILLIVVIAIVKTGGEKDDQISDLLSETQEFQAESESGAAFEQVPIIKEEPKSDEEFEKIVEEIKEEKKAEEVPAETPKTVQKEEKKPEIKKEEPKKQTLVAKKEKTETLIKSGYYIQVGAFFKNPPSKEYLSKIKQNGFEYVIKTVIKDSHEIKKVLIGPYVSKAEAREALMKIKRKINKDAFIVKGR
ncbi:SPOR domain-containing protein [Nitrosophilus alvini]|uniref:SPOR domain-containing protein n=1 Tax=Nitrosophilus alvini TaxID=2714855 RepID=UPI00190A9D91|nr:SPOR domain-containing protein [Nitrosophilus alvini]